jgi:outer membrane receptor protein involved in Fe transport
MTGAIIAVLFGPVFNQTVAAQEGAAATERQVLDEIVVTARKRVETALEIPESINTISAETIDRANITGLEDIGAMVSNLSLSQRADGFPNVSIRGLGSFGNTQGVGFYIDDVQNFTDASARIGDVERIEVLKGPQGTLYGGSNIGGAIRFVPVRPDPLSFSGRIKSTLGEQSLRDIELMLNMPLGGSDWALRVFGYSAANDGFLVNGNLPRANGGEGSNDPDIGAVEEYGARVSLAGPMTDRLSFYGTLRWNELDAPNDVWTTELDNNFEFPTVLGRTYNPRMYRDTAAGTLQFDYDLDAFLVTSVTSFTDSSLEENIDLDISQEYVLDIFRPIDFEIFTQELRLTSKGTGPFEWLVGLYYLDFKQETDALILFQGGVSLFDGIIPTAAEEATTVDVATFEDRLRRREQVAAFANASYRFGDWEVGAGVRIDRWDADVTNRASGISGQQDDVEFLLRASLAYFLGDEGSNFYANVSQGFEPGSFNLSNFEGEVSLFGYEPEQAMSYEVGYKGRLAGGRVIFTAAAFRIDYEARQFEQQLADPVTGDIVEGIINVGDSTQHGMEFDVSWQATDTLTMSFSGGYVDGEWDGGTVLGDGSDVSGLTPPFMIEDSFTLALDYDRPIRNDLRFLWRVQASEIGTFQTDLLNRFQNPDYTLVNLRVGVAADNWQFAMNVENVLDEKHYTDTTFFPNFNPLVPQPSLVIGTHGQVRLITASLSVSF